MISSILAIGAVALLAAVMLGVIVPNFQAFVDFVQRGIEFISGILPGYIPPVIIGVFGTVASVLLICKIINR